MHGKKKLEIFDFFGDIVSYGKLCNIEIWENEGNEKRNANLKGFGKHVISFFFFFENHDIGRGDVHKVRLPFYAAGNSYLIFIKLVKYLNIWDEVSFSILADVKHYLFDSFADSIFNEKRYVLAISRSNYKTRWIGKQKDVCFL